MSLRSRSYQKCPMFFMSCNFRPPPLTLRQYPLMDSYSQSSVTASSWVSSPHPSFWSTPPPQSVAMVTRQPGGGATPSLCASRCTPTSWRWLTAWTSQNPGKTLGSVTHWPESRLSRRSCVTSCPNFMTSSVQKRRRSGWFLWMDKKQIKVDDVTSVLPSICVTDEDSKQSLMWQFLINRSKHPVLSNSAVFFFYYF